MSYGSGQHHWMFRPKLQRTKVQIVVSNDIFVMVSKFMVVCFLAFFTTTWDAHELYTGHVELRSPFAHGKSWSVA